MVKKILIKQVDLKLSIWPQIDKISLEPNQNIQTFLEYSNCQNIVKNVKNQNFSKSFVQMIFLLRINLFSPTSL